MATHEKRNAGLSFWYRKMFCVYVCVYVCVGVYAYMHVQKNINSTAYKSDYSIYLFFFLSYI